jgi:hypothetical protein
LAEFFGYRSSSLVHDANTNSTAIIKYMFFINSSVYSNIRIYGRKENMV